MSESNVALKKEDVAIYVEPKKRMPLVVILMLGFTGSAIFGYGLATAMVAIGTEMNNFAMIAWLFTASNIVQMVMQPLIPGISSKITLPRLVLIGLIVAVAANGLFMVVPTLGAMIALRAFTGFGGAVINTGGMALAGQVVTPDKRATVTGLNMAFNGIGSVVGPLLAGAFTDMGFWRGWTLVALVVMVVTLILYIIFYPKGVQADKGAKFDLAGVIFLAIIFVALAMFLQMSGTYWAWLSAPAILLLVVTAVFLILFIKRELKVEKAGDRPAFRVTLFKFNPFLIASLCALVVCIGTNGIATYVPTYGQTVLGLSATQSSLGYSIGSILVILVALMNTYFFGKKRWFKFCNTFGCACGIVVSVIFLLAGHMAAGLFIFLIAFYCIWTGWISSVNFAITQMMLKTEDILDGVAGVTSMQMIGAFLGVALNAALVNTVGFNGLWIACIVSFLASLVIMLFLKDPAKE